MSIVDKERGKRYANEELRRALHRAGIDIVLKEMGLEQGKASIIDHIVRTIQTIPLDPAVTADDVAVDVIAKLIENKHRIDPDRKIGEKVKYIQMIISTQVKRAIYRKAQSYDTIVPTAPENLPESTKIDIYTSMTKSEIKEFFSTITGIKVKNSLLNMVIDASRRL